MEPFVVVIPARMAATRLPGKPLLDIAGRPMISWVYKQATQSSASHVIIATDDEQIADACRSIGASVEMTSEDHASGSDRIFEVADRLAWDDEMIIVNVQGDEPLLPPKLIDQVAGLLADHPDAGIATLMTPFLAESEFSDSNTAKVVVDKNGYALYFSRAPIPASRSGGLPPLARRHVGLYAYRVRSLRVMTSVSKCELENSERLEQLRALWLGERIIVADAAEIPPRGVDTAADLEFAREQAARQSNA